MNVAYFRYLCMLIYFRVSRIKSKWLCSFYVYTSSFTLYVAVGSCKYDKKVVNKLYVHWLHHIYFWRRLHLKNVIGSPWCNARAKNGCWRCHRRSLAHSGCCYTGSCYRRRRRRNGVWYIWSRRYLLQKRCTFIFKTR